jgi:hypothetical protein
MNGVRGLCELMTHLHELVDEEFESLRKKRKGKAHFALLRIQDALLVGMETHDVTREGLKALDFLAWASSHPLLFEDVQCVFGRSRDCNVVSTRRQAYQYVRDYWTQLEVWRECFGSGTMWPHLKELADVNRVSAEKALKRL